MHIEYPCRVSVPVCRANIPEFDAKCRHCPHDIHLVNKIWPASLANFCTFYLAPFVLALLFVVFLEVIRHLFPITCTGVLAKVWKFGWFAIL